MKSLIKYDGEEYDDEDEWFIDGNLGDLLMVDNSNNAFKDITCLDSDCKLTYMLEMIENEFPKDYVRSSGAIIPKSIYTTFEFPKNTPYTYVIRMLGIGLGDGAHWCAYVYDVKEDIVHLYDSMQVNSKHGIYSDYTSKFKIYAKRFFNTKNIVVHSDVRDKNYIRQLTGGFPEVTEKDIGDKYFSELSEDQQKLIQNYNSQHHFCYMEALLFIIEFLLYKYLGYKPPPIDYDVHPIFYIKRFIWALTNVFDNDTDCECNPDEKAKKIATKFYNKNFGYVWSQFNGGLIPILEPDSLDRLDNISNLIDLIEYTYDTSYFYYNDLPLPLVYEE